ncbi:hypothetical protein DPMN_051506 [Dreissena polymorpha]|uniref:Uncharacterized protein n=1 Tax=Dreissena polymorpha TaxID=45954 RepID=A0A9D4CIP2_DREPO|nr:hypothetical protein DPMN_051506 [Dreissena polymorpha]
MLEKFDFFTEIPPDDSAWSKNNPQGWPRLVYENLVYYMILKKAYDGKEMRAFRVLYGKNYVESGWLEDVWHCKEGDLHFMKATVSPSQPGVGRSEY